MAQQDWHKELCEAARSCDLNRVKECIEKGADTNEHDANGDTPLAHAANGGSIEIVEHILSLGVDVNKAETPKGRTPLSWACFNGHLAIVKFLAEKNANLETPDPSTGHIPLTISALYGREEVVKYLLKLKMDKNKFGLALAYSARNGYLRVVQLLAEAGADLNFTDSRKKTALAYALEGDNLDIVEYLIKRGCKTPLLGEAGQYKLLTTLLESLTIMKTLISERTDDTKPRSSTFLINAIKNGNLSVIKYLVGQGVDVCNSNALSRAALSGHLNVVTYLLDKGSSVNEIDTNGNTPLTNAVKSKNKDIVKVLVENGADPCKAGRNGTTPLLVAVDLQKFNLVTFLLENGAKSTMQTAFIKAIQVGNFLIVKHMTEKGALVNFTYQNGHTPFTKAVEAGNVEIAKYLLEQGADPKVVINEPKNVFLMKTLTDKNIDMMVFLVELGAKLDLSGDDGYTPLTKAVETEHLALVKYLADKGANVNFVDDNKNTPLAIAALNHCFCIATFLIDAGADVKMARSELVAYSNWNEDFAIYLRLTHQDNVLKVTGSGHEECDAQMKETGEENK